MLNSVSVCDHPFCCAMIICIYNYRLYFNTVGKNINDTIHASMSLLITEDTSDHLQKQTSGLQSANMLEKALGLQP